MEYIKVGRLRDLDIKTHKVIRLVGRLVGIIKRQDGSLYAVEVSCKHQGANLLAHYEGGSIATCWRHDWQYNLETGFCLNHESPRLKRYDLKIEKDLVYISLQPMEFED